ncbi:MAG: hypothetical protein PHI68_06610 [Candidatus Cloacimonetes bacterium]|nr:hypothetical protein [Candidatus Cloacimonadota bacterium]
MIYAVSSVNWQHLSEALLITAKGMLGIFLFMGIFYALIYTFELVFKEKK